MPRRARLEIPGVPMHVTQRGVNRCATFIDDDDGHHYIRLLQESCARHGVAVHAYVLMDNHVHLLVSAGQSGAVANAMRRVGQLYMQAFNQRHGRSGTLWQGRFKSCLVDSERYLLEVMRYIELNPARAAMTDDPALHRWSSVHAHLGLRDDPVLTPHQTYDAFVAGHPTPGIVWRNWLQAVLDPDALSRIRTHLAQERALGSARFHSMVEKALNRPVAFRAAGRPRKAAHP